MVAHCELVLSVCIGLEPQEKCNVEKLVTFYFITSILFILLDDPAYITKHQYTSSHNIRYKELSYILEPQPLPKAASLTTKQMQYTYFTHFRSFVLYLIMNVMHLGHLFSICLSLTLTDKGFDHGLFIEFIQ